MRAHFFNSIGATRTSFVHSITLDPRNGELTDLHFKKAILLLSKGDDDSLTYACLELRKSLEAYAYDLLSRYLSEAPFRVIQRVWQADKVLKELFAIDPKSSTAATMHMQREASATEPE